MYVIRYFYCCLLIALCLVCLLTGLLLLGFLRACWFDGYAHVLILVLCLLLPIVRCFVVGLYWRWWWLYCWVGWLMGVGLIVDLVALFGM